VGAWLALRHKLLNGAATEEEVSGVDSRGGKSMRALQFTTKADGKIVSIKVRLTGRKINTRQAMLCSRLLECGTMGWSRERQRRTAHGEEGCE